MQLVFYIFIFFIAIMIICSVILRNKPSISFAIFLVLISSISKNALDMKMAVVGFIAIIIWLVSVIIIRFIDAYSTQDYMEPLILNIITGVVCLIPSFFLAKTLLANIMTNPSQSVWIVAILALTGIFCFVIFMCAYDITFYNISLLLVSDTEYCTDFLIDCYKMNKGSVYFYILQFENDPDLYEITYLQYKKMKELVNCEFSYTKNYTHVYSIHLKELYCLEPV